MIDAIDAAGGRIVGYFVLAALACSAGLADRRRVAAGADLWPMFWWLTALVLLAMGGSRLLEIDDLVADFGRAEARDAGWYDQRRGLQALVVASIAGVWGVATLLAIWRVPERRRRYLPAAILTGGLLCYAAVRMVSLHHIDALLYNRTLFGARFVAWFEWVGLAVTGLSTVWFPFASSDRGSGTT